jgi:hypothetical protein
MYKTLEEVKQAIESGKQINWLNGLYIVKIDFDGDLVIKSTSGNGGELLTEKHLNELF